jgi:hypothetical protein
MPSAVTLLSVQNRTKCRFQTARSAGILRALFEIMNPRLFLVVLVAATALLVYSVIDGLLTSGQAAVVGLILVAIALVRMALRRKPAGDGQQP